MLTSESEVDERLRRMNAVFFASLEGLGGAGAGACAGGAGGRGVPPALRVRMDGLLMRAGGDAEGVDVDVDADAGGQGSEEVIGRLELDEGRGG
jgi:hypothetical protein